MARGKEVKVEDNIYRSVATGRYRIKVSVVIKGQRVYPPAGEPTTFHKDTPVARVKAQKHHLLELLQKLVEKGGGQAEAGLFNGVVAVYWTRQTLSAARKKVCESQYVPFWLERFGTKTPEWMLAHIPELKAAVTGIQRLDGKGPVSASTRDHYVAALSNIFTVVFGEDAPNPGKKIGVFAETDPQKLPRKDVPYWFVDFIFAQMPDRWRGHISRSKLWLRCHAYGGVTLAQLAKMGADDFYPRQREIIPAHREKGAGAATNRRQLLDEGYEAFCDFDQHAQWGTALPTGVQDVFTGARKRALAYLKAHPEVIPADVRIDFKRLAKMTSYWFRHTFASMVLEKTRSRAVAAQYLGHASEKMVGRYTQGIISDQLEAAGGVLAASFRTRTKLTLVEKPKRHRAA